MANHGYELLEICRARNVPVWAYTWTQEARESGLTEEEVFENMRANLKVMQAAAEAGIKREIESISGMLRGDAYRLGKYAEEGNSLAGSSMLRAMARALSCSEVNASMGKIVAAPTAGACGVLPAAVITAGEKLHKADDDLIRAFFTAAAVGRIIAKNATIAWA